MADDEPADFECPLCETRYDDYWRMVGCAGRDLATAQDPDSPTGHLLAARPAPRDEAPARRPTMADLTVYAVAALLKVQGTLGGLQEVAATASGQVEQSTLDRADLWAALGTVTGALTVIVQQHAALSARVEALEPPTPSTDPPPTD